MSKIFDRVIPGKEIIKNFTQPLTDGEKYLLNYLDEYLQKDNNFTDGNSLENYNGWIIFVQPYMNGNRPDIVIFHPKVGVQIFEIKDWNLDNYTFQNDDKGKPIFCVTDIHGTYPIKTPRKQVEFYNSELTGLLVPQIGEIIDENEKNYGLVRTALYFHKAETKKVQDLFKGEIKNYEKLPTFGYDFLKKENMRKIVPNSYLRISKFWKKEWNVEILFWLNPPFHTLEQTTKLYLNDEQKKFAEPLSGHHRVRGVVGSGKTQVLAYRAGKLASEGKKVLILTFNITLWHYINDMVKRSPFKFEWKNITRNHFHGFCKMILNKFEEKWPIETGDNEEIFKIIVPNKVEEVIYGKNYDKYDVILIDEGQDYYIEWYQMLCKFLTNNDEIVVVCDKKQNIYGRETEWLDKRRKGTEKFGEWYELKKILRLPEKIAKISKEFAEMFDLNQDIKIGNIEKRDLFNQLEDRLIWWNIIENERLIKINEAFSLIKTKGIYKHPSDLVILLPDKNFGNECVHFFESKYKIKVNHVFGTADDQRGKRKKMAFWMGDSRLKMSTIHSFKGWEVPNVILFIPNRIIGDTKLFDMLVYTAITRTKQNIIIINANDRYLRFGENRAKTWD